MPGSTRPQLRQAVNRVTQHVKPVQVVHHRHVEWSGGRALFVGAPATRWCAPAHKLSTDCAGYPHLCPVFLVVVDQRDGLVVLLNAIHGHAHLAILRRRLQHRYVVDRLPIAVVDLEPLPLRRQARRKAQVVHFQS